MTEDDTTQVRPLAAALQEIDRGRLHQQGSEQLHELLAACLQTGKSGSLTMTLEFKVDSADDRRLIVAGRVTTKLPQPPTRTSIFFVDTDGNLTRKDPTQLEFEITPVKAVATTIERQAK